MKKGGVIALVVLVVATLGYVLFGMSGGDAAGARTEGEGGSEGAGGAAVAAANAGGADEGAPKVGRDENEGNDEAEKDKDLRLPGQLPSLDLPAQAPEETPTKPHSEVELEGTIQQVDAEMAIRAVFPKIRSCFAELRERAPQARGRMLMKMKVRKGDDGSAGTGELFLKETQFTDPKYLTCVRTAIDETKFKTGADQIDGSFTFTLWLSPEDVDKHRAYEAQKGAPAAER